MFEAKSFEIRRFFDLLGSTLTVLLFGFGIWQEFFRFQPALRYLILALLIAVGLAIYLSFYKLIWKFLNTRFLYGYANFLIISVLSVSVASVIAITSKALLNDSNFESSLNQFQLLISRFSATKLLLFYWGTSLPMTAFWLIGVLTAWKFSKRRNLP